MDINVWLAYVAASVVVLLIPGPTIVLVLSYALSRGRSVAFASVTGVMAGDFIAMSASLAGLGALVATSATWFSVLKWAGALYLVWLGIKLIRSTPQDILTVDTQAEVSKGAIFVHNATVTALNPKSVAFFIAFVPQFVDSTAPLLPQFAILIATFVTLAACNTLAYALAADHLRSWIARPNVLAWMTRIGGATLIAMGVATAALRRAV